MPTKPLIFIPSPRDLPEFKDSVDKLKFDKLWVKYYDQESAYQVGRNWFLEHEYTHFVILPDDLIVKQEDIERLVDYNITSGWCVHGKSPKERVGKDSNISLTLPPVIFDGRYEEYNFLTVQEIQTLIKKGKSIIPIVFAGFAPTVIPRNFVEQIAFRTEFGCCVDTCLCQDLQDRDIVHYADLRVKTREIEATDLNLLQVGKKKPAVIYEKW